MSFSRYTRYTALRLFRSHMAFSGRNERFCWAVLVLLALQCSILLLSLLFGYC